MSKVTFIQFNLALKCGSSFIVHLIHHFLFIL